MTINVFDNLDFAVLNSSEFKEDSVREVIISPLLYALGYTTDGLNRIIRSRSLTHPFVNIGSTTRPIQVIPDYLLVAENKPAWILDAKAPTETIESGSNVEQAYSYAIHPEIRASIFALCNGREFIAFRVDQERPILYFQLSEIKKFWPKVYDTLAPSRFNLQAGFLESIKRTEKFDYNAIKPVGEVRDLKKQSAKRHYGVHPYFTKQVWNVVQEYIKNFTQPNDMVLDPFGGTGVTLVEALVLGRKGIHIDINPLSIFIVKNLIAPVNTPQLAAAFEKIEKQFQSGVPRSEQEIEKALTTFSYPRGVRLPANSDVETLDQLFSPRQLAQLAFLKHLIKQEKDEGIQGSLLLMFSGLLNKINLTYHASSGRSEGRGDSAVFRYYRYRVAPNPAELDLMQYFRSRLKKVIAAKAELAPFINSETISNAQVYQGTATNLDRISDQSVDYIYTDPPYGKKIQYLDLSVMWNAWLDLPVQQKDFELEAIEGGTLNNSCYAVRVFVGA